MFSRLVVIAVLTMAGPCSTAQEQAPPVDPKNVQAYDDLRGTVLKRWGISLVNADLRDRGNVLTRVTFDTRTGWPPKDRLPQGFDPQQILERGKNPGLGVRALHGQGITGTGVHVAIIDQPLLRDHQEYKDKVASYTAIDCAGVPPQMHGAAVASLLVGTNCGVAPGAALHYWAEPMWKRDYSQRTEALRQIIEFNNGKPLRERIRVVSVSIGFNSEYQNLESWKTALSDAKKQGLIVIHCSANIQGVGCPLDKDPDEPANHEICYFARGHHLKSSFPKRRLYVPIDNRTTAGFEGVKDYAFFADGGLSWGAPYLAGVIALGYQVDPRLDIETVFAYLRETGTPFIQDGWIVNPRGFIKKIRETKAERAAPSAQHP
jgi:hypothetical protein